MALTSPLSAQFYWRTDAATGQTWTGPNWSSGSATATGGTAWTSASNAVFSANSTLAFVDATIFGNVTVNPGVAVTVIASAGNAGAGAHTIDVGAGSTLTWANQAFAVGSSAIKNGAGTWDLGNPGAPAKAFSAGFTLNAGTVIASSGNSLGKAASPLTINGGIIQGGGSFAPTVITIGGNFGLAGTSSQNFGGAIALGAATRTISFALPAGGAPVTTFSGSISGAAGTGLILTGTGTALFSGTNNTYDGGTTISGGLTVRATGVNSLGTGSITLDGGSLAWTAAGTPGDISARLILGAAGGTFDPFTYDFTFSSAITGTGGLTKSGTNGSLTLAAANTYSGATTVSAGSLTLGNNLALQNSALNTAGAGVISLSSVTTPTFGGLTGSTDLASVITTGYGNVTALTLNPGLGSSVTYSGVIANGAAGMTLTKTGAGTQILSGANTYSGGTLATSVSATTIGGDLTFSSGTLAPNSTSTGSLTLAAGKTFTMSGGTLQLTLGSSFDQIVSAGAGTLSLTGGTINFGTTGAGFSYASGYQIFSGFGSASFGSLTLGGYDTAGYSAAISNAGLLTFSASAIPEPSTYAALFGALTLGVAAWRRRRTRGAGSL